ncbi:N-acetylmuramoyl-L-alanine amidase, partial [Salegentibacter echinorum]
FVFGQEMGTQKRIIIDVGHGGKDSGAIGINGILEKDVVMNVANEILKLNKELEDPLDMYLTRYSDTLISLSHRTKLAATLNVDLFISLHCNHSDNPNARGVEVYVAGVEFKYSDESVWFAFQLQGALNKELGFESRGVKFDNFQVLRETTGTAVALLLELGFLSNWDEALYLSRPASIKSLAQIVYQHLRNL